MIPDQESVCGEADFVREMMANDAASAGAGVRVLHSEPGRATVSMTVTPSMVNGHSVTHGGYVFLLADTAFAVACNGYGRATVASGGSITFIAPSHTGDELIAEATERARWGRSGIYDVTVRRDGELIAEFRGNSRELR